MRSAVGDSKPPLYLGRKHMSSTKDSRFSEDGDTKKGMDIRAVNSKVAAFGRLLFAVLFLVQDKQTPKNISSHIQLLRDLTRLIPDRLLRCLSISRYHLSTRQSCKLSRILHFNISSPLWTRSVLIATSPTSPKDIPHKRESGYTMSASRSGYSGSTYGTAAVSNFKLERSLGFHTPSKYDITYMKYETPASVGTGHESDVGEEDHLPPRLTAPRTPWNNPARSGRGDLLVSQPRVASLL